MEPCFWHVCTLRWGYTLIWQRSGALVVPAVVPSWGSMVPTWPRAGQGVTWELKWRFSVSLSTEGTRYPLGVYRLVFWANKRQVDGHVCVVFFQAVFFPDEVFVRRDGTKLWHFSAAVFWQKVFGIWSAGSWNFWKVLEGAARNVCTKKRRFLFWRFVKEQMRSRLLRPRIIKRTKKKGRACVSHSIESYKCAETWVPKRPVCVWILLLYVQNDWKRKNV